MKHVRRLGLIGFWLALALLAVAAPGAPLVWAGPGQSPERQTVPPPPTRRPTVTATRSPTATAVPAPGVPTVGAPGATIASTNIPATATPTATAGVSTTPGAARTAVGTGAPASGTTIPAGTTVPAGTSTSVASDAPISDVTLTAGGTRTAVLPPAVMPADDDGGFTLVACAAVIGGLALALFGVWLSRRSGTPGR